IGADLRGTILTGARLDGTHSDWRWSAIPAELLRQRQGPWAEGSRLIVALAFHDDPDPWSWLKLVAGFDRLAGRALGILPGWVQAGAHRPRLAAHPGGRREGGRARPGGAGKAPAPPPGCPRRPGPRRHRIGSSLLHAGQPPVAPADDVDAPK